MSDDHPGFCLETTVVREPTLLGKHRPGSSLAWELYASGLANRRRRRPIVVVCTRGARHKGDHYARLPPLPTVRALYGYIPQAVSWYGSGP